ncbi:M15 family metallopeptidase [Gordonia liuliyuniae]|uniref:M15 family metallopeptidase n=1 Tax=Gordonia liuliyuniae TaxID=2911517 RepID=A0ABS9IQ57_9ACTN|nr:M15 family metallopeptidase [Gordonia liuliyuniae]MCF8587693.1 M15 family metallopeptidase [Gordonia liuliyuniae]
MRIRVVVVAVMAVVVSLAAGSVAAGQAVAAPPARILGAPMAAGTGGLAPELAVAYTLARRDAQRAGVPMHITSGKRSRAEQNQLWQQGIRDYGSAAQARRWVLPPHESTHVTGHAIDVGPRAGAAWLQRNGNRYGLCRSFDNEWWHFEFLTFPGTPCPPRIPDASHRR